MRVSSLFVLSACGLLLAHSVACSSKDSSQAQTGDDANIIGGVDATSASLSAVGAILYRDPTSQQLLELCSASLIGPQTILTAKHCAVQFGQTAATDAGPAQLTETRFIEAFTEMYFAIGPDTKNPTRTVRLDAVSLCNEYQAGWIGMGCDFSTYHLTEAVTNIKPLKVAPVTLTEALVGKKLTAVGYGAQNVPETAIGTRKAGTLTLRTTMGAPLHVLYPTVDAFSTAVAQAEGIALTQNSAGDLQTIYDMQLKPGYEVFLGGADGDAQVCHGDSGGPLLMVVDGELVIQGVASAVGISGARLPCNMGAIYAVPGAAAQDLIRDSLTDPCAGVPAGGRCEGDVAVRCTNADEGPRRVTKTDCAGLLQHCVAPSSSDAGAEGGVDPDGGVSAEGGSGGAASVTTVACTD